ncbi:MAG: tyrosine-type recombinase/integrase [Acidobacteriota bacterium]|nr:tyrosine-type recombinase/integrase [Acidobacteriota bacterium]
MPPAGAGSSGAPSRRHDRLRARLRWPAAGRAACTALGGRARAHAADRARGRPDGNAKRTKTRRARSVRLLAPLAAELREWRLAAGRPAAESLLIPGPSAGPMTKLDWQVWVRGHWNVACHNAGLEHTPRPYDLRHSFASLLLAEGRQPLYVAQQLGHSPAVLLSTYAHLIPEFEDASSIDPEPEILAARAGHVRPEFGENRAPQGERAPGH